MKQYEVSILKTDSSMNTEILSEREAEKRFGYDEWQEIKENYLPHIAVICLDDE